MYAPVVRSARSRRQYRIGDRRAALLDEIVADGGIGYEYLVAVFEPGGDEPFLLVSSERNRRHDPLRTDPGAGASHFFCFFDEQGHHNMGDSDDWGDPDLFEAEALRFLERRLGAPVEVV